MANSNRLTLNWVDIAGKVAKVAVLVAAAVIDPSGAVVTAIRNAIAAVSRSKNNKATLSRPSAGTGAASDGVYEDIEDKAVMTFVDANGKTHNFKLPAPKAAIFMADKQTVDKTNALVIAYAGAMTDNARTHEGASLITFVGGRRIRTARSVR